MEATSEEMETSRKVLAVMLAADDSGHREVQDPLLQALIFELNASAGVNFHTYSFGSVSALAPDGEKSPERVMCPYSPELDSDLSELVLAGQLDRHCSVVTYALTSHGRQKKEAVRREFASNEPQ